MATNHKSVLHLIVLISNSILVFGPFYLYDTIISLQPLLIGQPCMQNISQDSSHNCCMTCLGFSPFEYNTLVGLPLAFSTIIGLISGFVIDRYGYSLLTFVSALFVVLGGAVRALGGRAGLSKLTSFALMLTGGFIVDNAFTVVYLVQLYVCARWFSGQYLSMVVGFCISVSLSGSVVAYYVNPIMVTRVGLENTLWLTLPVAATCVIAALILCVAEKLAKRHDVEVQHSSPTKLSLAILRDLGVSYWLVSIVIGFAWTLFYAFIGNSVGYQVDIFQVEYKLASFSSGVMYITKIGFSPIAGWIASRFDIHGPVALVGCFFNVTALAMLSLATGPPIVIIVLMGLGFAIVYTIMAAVLTELVPFDKLATANGIMNGVLCLGIGAGDLAVGGIAEASEERKEGWLNSGRFLLLLAVAQTITVAILMVMDMRSSKRVMCWTSHWRSVRKSDISRHSSLEKTDNQEFSVNFEEEAIELRGYSSSDSEKDSTVNV